MQYESMNEFITAFRERRRWSLRRLARELGYSSVTSLARLCQGKANAESVEKFAALVHAMETEGPSKEETTALTMLVEHAQAGDESYRTSQQLMAMLRDEPLYLGRRVVLEDAVTGEQSTLTQRYAGKAQLRITILNCEHVPLYEELAELQKTQPFQLRQYFVEDGPASQTVERIRAIMPVLYNANYQVYSRDMTEQGPMGMQQSDLMVCGWQEEGFNGCEVITFLSSEKGYFHRYSFTLEEMLPLMMIHKGTSSFHPVRMVSVEHEDFVEYCRYCADLERDRTVMRIKPDFGVELIPTHILADAFAQGEADPEVVRQMLEPLTAMFAERRRNALSKHAPQYHVLMRWGAWRFVRTGRLSDHPWLLRSFTVEERREILTEMLRQILQSPNFHLAFAQEDKVVREDEFAFYEGKGLCIVKPHTEYQLDGEHAEVMVSQQRFIQAYRSFFLDSIMRYHTSSQEQTIALLEEMIRYLSDHTEN